MISMLKLTANSMLALRTQNRRSKIMYQSRWMIIRLRVTEAPSVGSHGSGTYFWTAG